MKRFLALIPLLLLPLIVFAAPTIPTQTVWMTPEGASSGTAIVLSAFVYNTTQKSVTVTVGFFNKSTEVAQATSTISPQTALTLSAPWTVPEVGSVITAKVTKAVDNNKKEVPEIIGTVGTVTVGVLPQTTTTQLTERLRSIMSTIFAFVEPWRRSQAQYFETLRDTKKAILGIDSTKDAIDALNPITPEAPAVPGTDTKTEKGLEDIAPRYQGIPVGDYIVFLYATALATIFGSIALFYIVAILLALFVVRLIVRIVA